MAGLCHDAQVADTWATSDLGAGVPEAAGASGSTAAAIINKALLDAQNKLRISQQQVWCIVSHSVQVQVSSTPVTCKTTCSYVGTKSEGIAMLAAVPACTKTQ